MGKKNQDNCDPPGQPWTSWKKEGWGSKKFYDEVMALYFRFLDACLLWGFTFGDIHRFCERDDLNQCAAELMEATIRFFPQRYSEVPFSKVYGTLVHVAVVRENGKFWVRPEICTIFDEYHDRITPIIELLEGDCRYWIHSRFAMPTFLN